MQEYNTKIVNASTTKESGTTQYAIGDVVGGLITFSDIALKTGGSGIIINALLVDAAAQATKPDLTLLLFDTTLTPDADNAAFTPSDAEMETCLGAIKFTGANFIAGDATAGAGGNGVIPGTLSGTIPFKSLAGAKDIFGVLVAGSTYTPVTVEKFTIRLFVIQD